jgi:hypothetical protein
MSYHVKYAQLSRPLSVVRHRLSVNYTGMRLNDHASGLGSNLGAHRPIVRDGSEGLCARASVVGCASILNGESSADELDMMATSPNSNAAGAASVQRPNCLRPAGLCQGEADETARERADK